MKEKAKETVVETEEVIEEESQEESTEYENEEETAEDSTTDGESGNIDYEKLYKEEKDLKDKRKSRAKRGKARAKKTKSEEEIEKIVEERLTKAREKDAFISTYPNADYSIVSELANEKDISLKEAHILNEFREGRELTSEQNTSAQVHGGFKPGTAKKSNQYKAFEDAVPAFMK